MNKNLLLTIATVIALGASAVAAPDSYQVTGPIVEVTDTMIVVEKVTGEKKERFEIARTADTKVTGDLKVGTKVTIQYSMTAKNIEVKAGKDGDKPAKEKGDTGVKKEGGDTGVKKAGGDTGVKKAGGDTGVKKAGGDN
jgi:hypothetical protein